jgi:hypothetical protein
MRPVRLSTLVLILAEFVSAQTAPRLWRPEPVSNSAPHFEDVDGRRVLYVDALPFTSLAVEIPWMALIHGRYGQTLGAYDYLYPAARAMGLNTIKVPVKWSMVEPREGVYDFSYVDHVKRMAEQNGLKVILGWFGHYASGDGTAYRNLTGEVFAPMYVIEDEVRFPRAVDADGKAHHNCLSYDYPAVVEREVAAFTAFMRHIRQADAGKHTVVMIQVENEIAVFGADRRNPKLWRDHSEASNRRFAEQSFTDDLKFTAWDFAANWIKPITDAGAKVHPLPMFLNFVGGTIADWMVGGAPGEDVQTYLQNCPAIAFAGLNHYVGAPATSSVADFRRALNRYKVGRNLPALTETNSDRSPLAPRFAFLSIGEFGSPLFAPWALSISYPALYQPYVLPDGALANGAPALREAYVALGKALPAAAYFGGTDRAAVFMSNLPGERFSETRLIGGIEITVSGEDNAQAIAIRPAADEIIIAGYRCGVGIKTELARWPALKRLRVEKGSWIGGEWRDQGGAVYTMNQSTGALRISLEEPQAVRVYWLPGA